MTTRHLFVSVAALGLAGLSSGCYSMPGQAMPITSGTAIAAPSAGELPAGESAKLCFAMAEGLEQGGQHVEAIPLYEKVRQLDARFAAQATRRLAVLYDRAGNFPRALQEYQRALQENPKDAELFNNLGYGYYCRGDWKNAEKHLRQALAIDARLACAWTNLGMTVAQEGRYEESLTAFEKVVPKAQARCNLGFLLATQKKFDDARRQYELALQLEPNLEMARVALHKLGQPVAPIASRPVAAPRATTSAALEPAVPTSIVRVSALHP